MISALLDLVAPRAKARLEIELNTNLENFLSNLKGEHTLIESNQRHHKFRVNGNFFSDLKATGVVVRNNANPNHYENAGFYLDVTHGRDSKVVLKAEERVILGHLEVIAISTALGKMLTDLTEKHDRVENNKLEGDTI